MDYHQQIKDMIDKIINKDFTSAHEAFESIIADKVSDALEEKKAELWSVDEGAVGNVVAKVASKIPAPVRAVGRGLGFVSRKLSPPLAAWDVYEVGKALHTRQKNMKWKDAPTTDPKTASKASDRITGHHTDTSQSERGRGSVYKTPPKPQVRPVPTVKSNQITTNK